MTRSANPITTGLPFTPGPWTFEQDRATEFVVVDRDRTTLFELRFSIDIDERRIVPTASLIAAAPDLYAALEALVEFGKHEGERERRAREALAKARGERVSA